MKSHLYLSNLFVQNNEEITLKAKELLEEVNRLGLGEFRARKINLKELKHDK